MTAYLVILFLIWYKKNDFSLIHAHFLWFSKILPELKHLFSIPYVVTIHGSDIHEITSYDSNEIEKAMNVLTKADKNIFVSEYLLNHVSESENFILDYANAVIKWLKEEHNTYEIAQRVKGYTWENCVKKEIEVYKSL